MPKPRKDPYRPRLCRLCKLEFKPTTKNAKNADGQDFCTPAHRKEFWKHGKLPFQKLMIRIEKRLREIVREETDDLRTRIAALEENSWARAAHVVDQIQNSEFSKTRPGYPD